MVPDPTYLIEKAGISLPIIGFYDAPDPFAFETLVKPAEGRWACLFMFYQSWLQGETLLLTRENFGCGGAGKYLFGEKTRSRREYVDFLYREERLKASGDLMGQWIDQAAVYQAEHPNIMVGPLRDDQYAYLKTVSFLINPDQLSLLVTGAHYHQGAPQPPLVTAPFASGCGLLAPLFADLDRPQAIIGATDIAMRKYLPPDILVFTVTKPMYAGLCALDDSSFLNKQFWQDVVKSRKRGQKAPANG